MNFTTAALFVILTTGIHNTLTDDWEKDCQRLGVHFLKLIKAVQSELWINTNQGDPSELYENMLASAKGTLLSGYRANLSAFSNFTGNKIKEIIDPAKENHSDKIKSCEGKMRTAIETAAKDINKDKDLSNDYKMGRLPLRGYLLSVYVNVFHGLKNDFFQYSPEEEEASAR